MKYCYVLPLLTLSLPFAVAAHEGHETGIHSPTDSRIQADFDIAHARITSNEQNVHFHMAVTGIAGNSVANATGELAGSNVYSYVWPTNLSPAAVGFEADTGVLALAVTAHPDFDDTPLFDENNDGRLNNDGDTWHSHWVVLAPHSQCPEDGLGVVDIPEGETPALPATWPGLPILIDSPGWQPIFNKESLDVHVALNGDVSLQTMQFDAVTAGLTVNQSVHEPLLCVTDVFDTAGGLELPGKINQ